MTSSPMRQAQGWVLCTLGAEIAYSTIRRAAAFDTSPGLRCALRVMDGDLASGRRWSSTGSCIHGRPWTPLVPGAKVPGPQGREPAPPRTDNEYVRRVADH